MASIQFSYYSNYAQTGGLLFRIYDRSSEGRPGGLLFSTSVDLLSGGGAVTIPFAYDTVNMPARLLPSAEVNSKE